VEYVVQSGLDSDTLVMPITFLYRQHLELRIKALLIVARMVLKQPDKVDNIHTLEVLWPECHSLLKQIFKAEFAAQFKLIGQIVNEFAKADPGSYSFRYPVNTKGGMSLPKKLQNINLAHLASTVSGMAVFLDSLHQQIGYPPDEQE
jgi:hypothetical protein